ncbi:hypothetical protein [Pedobacter sp. SL55]|nr:hypothetical protein [Pedobacter sp. SL55]WAC41011.1 hypothetical protein OVA16_01105 [Pedobacter sp. SL55]
MNREELLKSKWFKLLLPIIILALAIGIYQNGYALGQWLYAKLHR